MPQPDRDRLYADLTTFLRTRVDFFAHELWSKQPAQLDAMKDARRRRREGYHELSRILHIYHGLIEGPERSALCEIQEEVQIRLGLWFCSYFLGFPLPHVWERVRHLESVLEGYSGSGALYDKLAGDIYRSERKMRDRHFRNPGTAEPGADEPVLVLAFSPTLLIADEELKGEHDDRSPTPHDKYLSALEKLAGCYLRLQMWLYLEAHGRISYAFQIESAAKALKKSLDGQTDPEKVREVVEERFRRMGGDQEKAKLFGIPERLQLEGGVFTSCTLGKQDGVLADRPQREAGSAKRSTWVRSQYLELEREKMLGLLYQKKQSSSDPDVVKAGIACDEAARRALLEEWAKIVQPAALPLTEPPDATDSADRGLLR